MLGSYINVFGSVSLFQQVRRIKRKTTNEMLVASSLLPYKYHHVFSHSAFFLVQQACVGLMSSSIVSSSSSMCHHGKKHHHCHRCDSLPTGISENVLSQEQAICNDTQTVSMRVSLLETADQQLELTNKQSLATGDNHLV